MQIEGINYKCCADCRRASASGANAEEIRAELRANRNADVDALQAALRGEGPREWDYKYWTPSTAQWHLIDLRGYDYRFAEALRWKEYVDPQAEETQKREEERMRKYKKLWRDQRKGEKK